MNWCTPQEFFDKLNDEFHFTLDAAATDKSAKCKEYYTPETDGLTSSWKRGGGSVFCNPPYGRTLGAWVKKAHDEAQAGTTIVLLIPARTDTTYFHEYIYGKAEIRFIRGRLKFTDEDGNEAAAAPFPSMVVIYNGGNKNMKIIIDSGAIKPTRAHDTDAGMDLYSPFDVVIPACKADDEGNVNLGAATIDTGIHVEIPRGHAGFLKSKSGLNVKHGITSEGVIDAGYTGSIVVKLYNATNKPYTVGAGDKISQLVILPIIMPELEIVDSLDATERGNGGFGSSGR